MKYGRIVTLALVAIIAAAILAPGALYAEAQHEKHIRLAAELLKTMGAESDAESFADSIKTSKGVAVFPTLIQAGIGIGGMTGEGVVLVRNQKGGWNGPSFVSLVGGSIGLQFGVQQVGLVLAIINDDGLLVFTGGQSFKLGGDVSIAAGPMGRKAEAATDSRAEASIYSYSMSKGLFAGLTLSGSTINVNGDANKAYWGKATDAQEALKKTASGAKIKPLVDELNRLTKMSK